MRKNNQFTEGKYYCQARKNLREARIQLGLTQRSLAKLLGVHYNTIISWETGQTTIPTNAVYRLCFYLHLRLEDVIDDYDIDKDERSPYQIFFEKSADKNWVIRQLKKGLKSRKHNFSKEDQLLKNWIFLKSDNLLIHKERPVVFKWQPNYCILQEVNQLEYATFKAELLQRI